MGVSPATESYNSRQITTEEQLLYNHFLRLVEVESPEILTERFRQIFLDSSRYSDAQVAGAMEHLLRTRAADQDLIYVLNRCCHILINRWQLNTRSSGAVVDLIRLFDNPQGLRGSAVSASRNAQRLRQVLQLFQESEQYLTLRRLLQVLEERQSRDAEEKASPLGTLIRRYPYLYEHCLLSDDCSLEHQNTIRSLQTQHQRQYELDLSQYVLYQVRCARSAKEGVDQLALTQRRIQVVANPTLLNNQELSMAVRHFAGKVESGKTYRDLAHGFQAYHDMGQSYGAFKRNLYQYMTSSVDPAYGKRRFNQQLTQQLERCFPEFEHQPTNDLLIVRTCGQLMNLLVVENHRKLDHVTFMDLINNQGATLTTGLLLKIVLICSKIKPYLEKRLSILFNHYEHASQDSVDWLVKMLENLNVAFSTNFGNANLSFLI
jgi:hypothetical protein